jgi:VanZ family protein
MINKILATAGWLVLAYITFATLSPIALRPEITNANFERFCAFAVVGFLFGLAYPRRFLLVIEITVGSAILLEALQIFVPGRHGRAQDALVKVAGGIAGILISKLASHLLRLTTNR